MRSRFDFDQTFIIGSSATIVVTATIAAGSIADIDIGFGPAVERAGVAFLRKADFCGRVLDLVSFQFKFTCLISLNMK